ncbi:hypothetical protein [Gluconobacter kondonii]|uniref:Uncharacterized protein n=1 Tax=Gluconobacter kondonii TaxID=941463 RepID=A0ABQ5WTZ7_9PROT|nr:hypothetical protein [Gluconobacter kondonii]GLQ66951.1 hypothetical protein GCM10007870_25360 [Gluconobacter kondonii]
MNYDEAIQILATSSRSDWVIDDARGTFTYKNDLNLNIKRDDEAERREFSEPWANKHPDPHAYSKYFDVRYGQSHLERKHLVVVDGGRAILPIPKSAIDLTVTDEDLNFARIIDEPSAVDEYLERSNIQVS